MLTLHIKAVGAAGLLLIAFLGVSAEHGRISLRATSCDTSIAVAAGPNCAEWSSTAR